ncbi:MAG: hypothetical protein P8129_02030 [Anaerolineae bacterium]
MGELWNPGPVAIYWDNAGGALVGQPTAGPDGVFAFEFTTPTDGSAAAPGGHMVIAVQGSSRGEAGFYLSAAPPTDTSTPTATPTPSRTWTPTLTPSPVTPSATPSRTPTLTPSPTFRAMTPMVTITPIPPTRRPPGSVATRTPTPTETGTPTPTQTPTPSPEPPTATVTPSVTATPSNTPGLATFEPTSSPEPVVDTVAPPTEVQSTTVAVARTREVTGTVSIEGAGTTSEPEEGGTGLASTRNLAVMSILLLMGGGAFGAMVTATGVGRSSRTAPGPPREWRQS